MRPSETNLKLVSIIVLLISHRLQFVSLVELEDELRLTREENGKLDMLKMRVGNIRAHTWLKTDLALLRWLRVNKLNVEEAETAFKHNLKWRKINRIDSILREDWTFWEREYYFDCSATDYTGRPVCTGDISEWDIRQAIISGEGETLLRYMIKTAEDASTRVWKSQEMGKNVTQWITIWNMDNFNLAQHGCVQCISLLVRFTTTFQTNYPNGMHKLISINALDVFQTVFNLFKHVMSKAMQDTFHIFGTNKDEWRKELLSLIPENELTPNFGGTKIR
ncbi:SEC14 cytosolic factor isoform X2 [Folsomia candida]|uniref:SEC14 cytosolic factor isoform X2 n=1 Tax=Folsomia candida TaxID=158441 RepID=UPI001604C2A8|nr:SEC14 cytosolic factor isoform X2 [Folsomia candida]